MNYEEKYKEVFKRAEAIIRFYKNQNRDDETSIKDLELIFPELKESEGEKVRKGIIELVKQSSEILNKKNQERMLAWLEKQIEQNPTLPIWKYKKDNTPLLRDSIILNKYGCVAKSPSGATVSDVWIIDYDELAKLPKEERKLEKIEQKPTDNVEPKFKVGDWIIRSAEGFKHNAYLVTDVKDYYVCEDLKGRRVTFNFNDVHKNFKLWDISDARGGDVLAAEPIEGYPSSFVAIYKKHDEVDFDSHCFIGFDGNFYKGEEGHTIENVHPATEEQRTELFLKMKEAGWEWDAEKKELKKIEKKSDSYCEEHCKGFQETGKCFADGGCKAKREAEQKSAWSEDDETTKNNISHIIRQYDKISKRENEPCWYIGDCLLWMQNIKGRVQPKQEWSEDDEEHVDSLLKRLDGLCRNEFERTRFAVSEDRDWLKSLKTHNVMND